MPRPVKTLLILLGLISAVAVGLLLNPALIARPVLESALSDAGFRLQRLEGLAISLGSASVNRLQAESDTMILNLEGVNSTFDFSELLGGRMNAIKVGSLALQIKEAANEESSTGSDSSNLDPAQLLDMLTQLPVAEISVQAARVTSTLGELNSELHFQTSPLSLAATGTWSGASELALSLSSTAQSESRFAVEMRVAEGNVALLQANTELSIAAAESAVSGTIEFDPQALANEFMSSELLNDWVLFNEQLQADFRTVFTTDNSGLQLESLSVDLDGAGSALQLAKSDEAGRTLTQLSLPIAISLLPNTVNESFRIQASDLYGTLSLTEADNEMYLEASLTE
ncbi:MAG: hypothetical protein MI746_12685, partial [Pseudomonadales bacterium]|nr:hypothetical protein [Pseudomonadales bacterium]